MKKHESFSDKLGRIYHPIDADDTFKVNDWRAKTITFQITEECNLNCSYCYQGAKSRNRMSFETAKEIVDTLLAADSRTNQYITSDKISGVILDFIGGEPLLEVDLIDQIMDYFLEQAFLLNHPLATRYMICISSNGTLYFTESVQRFLEKWEGRISFSVSVDGNKELHDSCRVFPDGTGSYDLAIAAAKDYMNKHGFIGSKMTIAPGNVMHVRSAVNSLLQEGYDEIYLNCVFEEGWELSHAQILYRQLRGLADDLLAMENQPYLSIFDEHIGHPMKESDNQNWCGGCGSMLAVNWKGEFFPCLRYMGSSLNGAQEPFIIGDLENGIMNLQEHRDRVQELSVIDRKSQSTEECWSCPIASGCAWCSAYNYQVYGTPNKRATFICKMHQARVLANAYYWNLIYKKENIGTRYLLDIPADWAVEIVGENEYAMLKSLAEEV